MSTFIFILNRLVLLACAIILFTRYRNTNIGIFGGIGFAVLFFLPLFQRLFYGIGFGYYQFRVIFDIFLFAAYCFILYALYLISTAAIAGGEGAFKAAAIATPLAAADTGARGSVAAARPGMTPFAPGSVSKPFYLGSILGSTTITILLFVVALMLVADNDEEEAVLFWVLGSLVAIYGVVIFAVLVHRMWNIIQDGSPRTTPGKAVGYLFIPFYNLYWIFQSFLGWAKDFNRYIREREIKTVDIPETFVKTLCIIAIIQAIPYIGILLSLFYVMLLSIFIDRACDGVNAVAGYKLALQNMSVEN